MKSDLKIQKPKNILLGLLSSFFPRTLHASPFTFHVNTFIKSPWLIALLLLGIFLATNGYIYGWDDQHVEIPLLKKLIDPGLYPNDYYVDALKANFMSYLYPILSKIITVEQIPATFFILYLLSRYFLFFFMYKIWHLIAHKRGIAILSVLIIMLLGRVEEFLYRTFSHQEFALAIIFAGIYFFYKERFVLAAAILGLAANFHALYSLFPMCYLGFFLLWHKNWKNLLKSCLSFILGALPFLIWAGKKYLTAETGPTVSPSEWVPLYQLACPQNFLFLHSSLNHIFKNFQTFWDGTGLYWLILLLTTFHILFSENFRKDTKLHAILISGGIFLMISFVFSYIYPSRFILDLNLIRNTQYMLFFLMGYLIVFLWELRHKNILKYFGCLIFLPWIRFGFYCAFLSVTAMLLIQYVSYPRSRSFKHWLQPGIIAGLLILDAFMLIRECLSHPYSVITLITFFSCEALVVIISIWYYFHKKLRRIIAGTAIAVPFVILMLNFMIYHQRHCDIQRHGLGFWQLQRNWIDMQKHVKKNTPNNAVLLVPHDMEMGGFRIHSERSIVMSYRDCGVVGFSYPAAMEWKSRLNDIGAFQVFIEEPTQQAIVSALTKYNINYIVFMNYFKFPETDLFQKIYENETFNLFHINRSP